LECRIRNCPGVGEVAANFRTGRILVRFDEQVVDRVRLAAQVEALLHAEAPGGEDAPSVRARGARFAGPATGQVARHLLVDAVAHALLPGPFALLLPTAVAAFRR
jgi:hypothetical protein